MSIKVNKLGFFHVINDRVYCGSIVYPISDLYDITEYCEKGEDGKWKVLLDEYGDKTITDIVGNPAIEIKMTFTVRKKP